MPPPIYFVVEPGCGPAALRGSLSGDRRHTGVAPIWVSLLAGRERVAWSVTFERLLHLALLAASTVLVLLRGVDASTQGHAYAPPWQPRLASPKAGDADVVSSLASFLERPAFVLARLANGKVLAKPSTELQVDPAYATGRTYVFDPGRQCGAAAWTSSTRSTTTVSARFWILPSAGVDHTAARFWSWAMANTWRDCRRRPSSIHLHRESGCRPRCLPVADVSDRTV